MVARMGAQRITQMNYLLQIFPNLRELRLGEVRRIYLPKLFGKEPKTSRACFFGGERRLIGVLSTPSWSPSELRFGMHPIFQTVSPSTRVNGVASDTPRAEDKPLIQHPVLYDTECFRTLTFQTILDTLDT